MPPKLKISNYGPARNSSQDGSQECHTRHHQLHGTTAQRERHTKQTKEKQGQFRVLSLGDLLAACFFPSEAGQKSLCWDQHDPTDFQWIQVKYIGFSSENVMTYRMRAMATSGYNSFFRLFEMKF